MLFDFIVRYRLNRAAATAAKPAIRFNRADAIAAMLYRKSYEFASTAASHLQ
jgi:hypothetical protein